MSKKFYLSSTIQFFAAVLLAGGLDILDQLFREETLDWRSIVVASIGFIGIALRLKTKDKVGL